jgi:hypothetical protein
MEEVLTTMGSIFSRRTSPVVENTVTEEDSVQEKSDHISDFDQEVKTVTAFSVR